jgi:predicted ATP-grasp superfamily ATP-dependent carboligase
MTTRTNGQWSLEYPKASFHPLHIRRATRDALVLLGPEPHFRWPELAPAIVDYARRSGVNQLLTLGAYVGAVSHREAPLVSRTLDPASAAKLAELGFEDSDYEGPTTFATALLHAAQAAGIPGISLWVATPPYLQAGNPVAALALVEAARQVTALPLSMRRLKETSESFLTDVDAALEEHPELAEQLREMLEAVGEEDDDAEIGSDWRVPDPDRPPPDAPPGLPTGKSLVEAVERYLRQTRGDDSPGQPPSTKR